MYVAPMRHEAPGGTSRTPSTRSGRPRRARQGVEPVPTPADAVAAALADFDPADRPAVPWRHLPRDYWTPDRIRRAPWNPRKKMPAARLARLRRLIFRNGLLGGLDVRAEDGLALAGHQRLGVILELLARFADDPDELTRLHLPGGKIPVNPVQGMSDADAMAVNVALNNREAAGEYDFAGLREIVSYLDAEGHDATLTGFDRYRVEDLVTWEPADDVAQLADDPGGALGDDLPADDPPPADRQPTPAGRSALPDADGLRRLALGAHPLIVGPIAAVAPAFAHWLGDRRPDDVPVAVVLVGPPKTTAAALERIEAATGLRAVPLGAPDAPDPRNIPALPAGTGPSHASELST